jgi:hypothetical protein
MNPILNQLILELKTASQLTAAPTKGARKRWAKIVEAASVTLATEHKLTMALTTAATHVLGHVHVELHKARGDEYVALIKRTK